MFFLMIIEKEKPFYLGLKIIHKDNTYSTMIPFIKSYNEKLCYITTDQH